jgi:hypothetical protein
MQNAHKAIYHIYILLRKIPNVNSILHYALGEKELSIGTSHYNGICEILTSFFTPIRCEETTYFVNAQSVDGHAYRPSFFR